MENSFLSEMDTKYVYLVHIYVLCVLYGYSNGKMLDDYVPSIL